MYKLMLQTSPRLISSASSSRQDRRHESPSVLCSPELAQVNALPGSQVELPVGDGNGDTGAAESRLSVAGGIVWSFVGVTPGERFGHYLVEGHVHICAHVAVEVLVEGKTGRRMLNKEGEDANLCDERAGGARAVRASAGNGEESAEEEDPCELVKHLLLTLVPFNPS